MAIPLVVQLIPLLLFGLDEHVVGSPQDLFVIMVSLTSLAALSSGMLINRARRTNETELGYLGLFFFTVAVLSIAQAITTPGVLFDFEQSRQTTTIWSIPFALVAALPAMLIRSTTGYSIDSQWRLWISTFQQLIVALAALLLVFPERFPSATVGASSAVVVTVFVVVGCAVLSKRHYDLAVIARSPEPLVVSLGYGLVGGSMLMWLGASPYSVAFWVSQFLLMFGAIAGTIGGLSVYRQTNVVRPMIASIIEVDPRCALEVGVEPSVQQFLRDIEIKDPVAADHIVRTTWLAMTVGPKLGLERTDLRDLGLAALLHDIGTLLVPEMVRTKSAPLDEDEYEILKRHAVYGADLVERSPALQTIAPAVRAHHEYIDGSGYPKGLRGPKVPLIARIVAVCDAFDALAHTRQYRPSLDQELAIEILERGAGSKWDRRVVETVVRTVRHQPPTHFPERLDVVGRIGCDCIPHVKQMV